MDNIFVEENVSYDNLNVGIPKKKIILFSVLAVLPVIFDELLTPVVYEIMSRNNGNSSVVISEAGIILSFLASVMMLAVLVVGGFIITRTKEGTVRFAGVFMFSSAIASCIPGVFDFLELVPTHTEIIEWFFLVLRVISAVITVPLCIKLFSIFEYRAEHRYVNGAEAALFRKRLIIFLVIVYLSTFAVTSGITPYVYAATGTTLDDVQPHLYIISITASLVEILMMFILYKLAFGVRKVKSDAIGFGAVYYIPGLVTTPVTLLTTEALRLVISSVNSNTLAIIQGFITMGLSLITTIAVFAIMFKVLKIFFPVKEEPAPEPDDRAEQILRNLIASKQDKDSEIK